MEDKLLHYRDLAKPVLENEPCFVKFKADNVIQGTPMPIHTNPRFISSLFTAIEMTSPALTRSGFKTTVNIAPVQFFRPEKSQAKLKKQRQLAMDSQGSDDVNTNSNPAIMHKSYIVTNLVGADQSTTEKLAQIQQDFEERMYYQN